MARFDDNESSRFVDRIRAIAFKEARDEFVQMIKKDVDHNFLSKKWIAEKIKRSEKFVQRHWNGNPYEQESDFSQKTRPLKLSQESQDIILHSSCKRKRSCSFLAAQILSERGKTVHRTTIRNYQRRLQLKPFHELAVPRISPDQAADRLWFCDYLSEWDEEDFLHLAPSDEFYIYIVRKPNSKNDIIWARSPQDIPDEEHYRQLVKNPECIGVFILMTATSLLWIIKDKGQSWDGQYFRTILEDTVIPFLRDPINVLDTKQVVFLHDKAPCMRALATQDLLRRNKIDFFGNDTWPGSSPDLNCVENLGAILKMDVEKRMMTEPYENQFQKDVFIHHVNAVLNDVKENHELFINLLRSYPRRLAEVKKMAGGPTKY